MTNPVSVDGELEARSLEQCVADARAILDGATAGPWEIEQYGGLWAGDDVLFPRPEYGQYGDPDSRLITLSRNTYSSLLDLVEALDAYVNLIGGRLPRKVERALTDVHESLQENLPR